MPPPVSKTGKGDLGKKTEEGKRQPWIVAFRRHEYQFPPAQACNRNHNKFSKQNVTERCCTYTRVAKGICTQFDNASHLSYFVELFSLQLMVVGKNIHYLLHVRLIACKQWWFLSFELSASAWYRSENQDTFKHMKNL